MKEYMIKIDNYFPLCYDIAEADGCEFDSPQVVCKNSDELMEWAYENQFHELQKLVLLTKNAFEGHCCRLNNFPIETLTENGTLQIELDGDNACRELALEFFSDTDLYQQGLNVAWEKMLNEDPAAAIFDFQAMLNFVLANQMFRLPISYVGCYDPYAFVALSKRQQEIHKLQRDLFFSMIDHTKQISLIEQINDIYFRKFKNVYLSLKSKEIVLMQLSTKLEYANDPNIETEEDLEKRYYDFLVGVRTSETLQNRMRQHANPNEVPEFNSIYQALKPRIKKLYKLISKNCREAHTDQEADQKFKVLVQGFVEANTVYNDFAFDFCSFTPQHSKLMLLFIKVLNNRKVNGWPVEFADYTGYHEYKPIRITPDDVLFCQNKLKADIEYLLFSNGSEYKRKYIGDEEIGSIHQAYLNSQLEFLDHRISEIMNEIKIVMQRKANKISNK